MAPKPPSKRRAERNTARAAAPPAPKSGTPVEQFVTLSAALTGYDPAECWGTGMVQEYFDVLSTVLNADFVGRLLTRWTSIHTRGGGDERFVEQLITDELLADDTLGPLARNVAAMWYLGMWYQLPAAWREANGAYAGDTTFVISTRAYKAGLVWDAMHTHPPAAKQPGYGSWARKPEGAE